MPISARNQLAGKVKSIKEGIVTAEVVVELPDTVQVRFQERTQPIRVKHNVTS